MLTLKREVAKMVLPDGSNDIPQLYTEMPSNSAAYQMKWDGEWQITYEVFRDLGAAFAIVLVVMYVLVVGWFKSYLTPLAIMAPIPLSLIGIIPAHGALGAFFTATSMIGFIALAGVVVRNSILVIDFAELRMQQGLSVREALVDGGAVRFRPMLLTAMAVTPPPSPRRPSEPRTRRRTRGSSPSRLRCTTRARRGARARHGFMSTGSPSGPSMYIAHGSQPAPSARQSWKESGHCSCPRLSW